MAQTLKMIVVCKNAAGEPAVFSCEVVADPDSGDQYDQAISLAEDQGYEHPMIAADESDHLYTLIETD